MKTEQTQYDVAQRKSVPFWTSYRLRLVILCSVGLMLASTHRTDLSLAMVCMVNDEEETNVVQSINSSYQFTGTTIAYGEKKTKNETIGSSTDVCPVVTKKNLEGAEFNWSKRHQGFMLGSFFWGYPVFQIPGGWMALRFGAKRILTVGILSGAVLNVITPWCARASPYLVTINRALSGMAHSLLFPAGLHLFRTWSTPEERGKITSLGFVGTTIGLAVTFPLSGLLCDYGIDGGWPSIFYLLGGLGVLWTVIWIWYAHDTPSDAPRLDPTEKRYLQTDEVASESDNKRKTPWMKILLSRSAWACWLSHVALDFGMFMLLTQLPTYMNEVLRFNIMSFIDWFYIPAVYHLLDSVNGLFLTLPYIGMSIGIYVGGYVSDKLIESKTLSIKWSRKITAVIGYIVPAALLIVMGTWNCTQQTAAIFTLIVVVSITGLQPPCVIVNYTEIGGQFSGILIGIGSVLSSVPGITAPYLVAVITSHKTQEEWMNAFIVAACVYVVGALVFCTLAKFELEPWAINDDHIPELESHTNTDEKRKEVFSIT